MNGRPVNGSPRPRKPPANGSFKERRRLSADRPPAMDNAAQAPNGGNSSTNAADRCVSPAPALAGKPSPDFVGSRYQATVQSKQKGTFVPEWVIQVTNNKSELLVLSQFAYWFGGTKDGGVRAKVEKDGRFWVYKTYGKLGKELHLSKHEVRGAVRQLVSRGLLIKMDRGNDGGCIYYRIDPLQIETLSEGQEK